jgi:hypothetical protein
MSEQDDGKKLLENIRAELYSRSAQDAANNPTGESFLVGADNQYLGKITDNTFDQNSITNEYGPFGSHYSSTSIFNEYSPYGSVYGQLSVNNPYCQTPPRLVLRGRDVGFVTVNQYVPNRISTKAFLSALKTNLRGLLAGQVPADEITVRAQRGDTFISAQDGTFLGSLNPNKYDNESLFNKYGPYGSRYSSDSIFNRYSPYGSQFSQTSAFNSRAATPPKVISGGREIAFLTKNQRLSPRLDPDGILDWATSNVRKHY